MKQYRFAHSDSAAISHSMYYAVENMSQHAGGKGILCAFLERVNKEEVEFTFVALDAGDGFVDRQGQPVLIKEAVKLGDASPWKEHGGRGLTHIENNSHSLTIIEVRGLRKGGSYWEKSQDGSVKSAALSADELKSLAVTHGTQVIFTRRIKLSAGNKHNADLSSSPVNLDAEFRVINGLAEKLATDLKRNKSLFDIFMKTVRSSHAFDKDAHKSPKVDIEIVNGYETGLSNLFGLLRNKTELAKLLFVLSTLRLAYDDHILDKIDVAPLSYAREKGLIFRYNDFIQICPITDSFRRHILIVRSAVSGRKYCLEIKMPGQATEDNRHIIVPNSFTIAKKAWEAYRGKSGIVKPVALVSAKGAFFTLQ